MYLREIDRIPDRGERLSSRANNRIKNIILNFYESPMDLAEVVFNHGEYSSSSSLYSCIRKALDSMEDLPIDVDFRQGGVYLRRTE